MPSLAVQGLPLQAGVSLRPYTTLKAGGPAELFAVARSADELASIALHAQESRLHLTVLGSGSNVLPADSGVPGLVALNCARDIRATDDGEVQADTGCAFQDVCLFTLQAGMRGMEFAVGIPGTLGGALVSNAGAYRSCISDLLVGIEIVFEGRRRWVEPGFLEFSYRNSILRSENPPQCVVVSVRLKFAQGERKAAYDEARAIQVQRIAKQPPPASAGSFFKNVNDKALADSLDGLPAGLKEAGVVPAGYLIEACGLKGRSLGGAVLSARHANFILNVGGASASSIRRLADVAKGEVFDKFGVRLQEEVLYLGSWGAWG